MAVKNEEKNNNENKISAKNLHWVVCFDTKKQQARVVPFVYTSAARYVFFHNYDVDKNVFRGTREHTYSPEIKVLLDDSTHKLADHKISLLEKKQAEETALKRVIDTIYPNFIDDNFSGDLKIYNHRMLENTLFSHSTMDEAYKYSQKVGVPLFSPIIPLDNVQTLTDFMNDCCTEYLTNWQIGVKKARDEVGSSKNETLTKNERER